MKRREEGGRGGRGGKIFEKNKVSFGKAFSRSTFFCMLWGFCPGESAKCLDGQFVVLHAFSTDGFKSMNIWIWDALPLYLSTWRCSDFTNGTLRLGRYFSQLEMPLIIWLWAEFPAGGSNDVFGWAFEDILSPQRLLSFLGGFSPTRRARLPEHRFLKGKTHQQEVMFEGASLDGSL